MNKKIGYTATHRHVLLNCELMGKPCVREECPFYVPVVRSSDPDLVGYCRFYGEVSVYKKRDAQPSQPEAG